MISLKKILVATDFSPSSEIAWKYGRALGTAFDSELVLVHALEAPDLLSQLPPTGEAYFPPNLAALQEEAARKHCESWLAAAAYPRARYVLRTGNPFVEVIAAAKEENADLIVVGTHGRGAVAHFLLGSVAERIVRKAPCPVLVVREGQHEFVLP